MEKVKRAAETPGAAYVHVLSVCPTGWRIPTQDAIKYGRLAVDSCVFPLYEVIEGEYRLSYKPYKKLPLTEYLKGQGRFRHLTDKEIQMIQQRVDKDYERILRLSEEEK
jgi:pyruvate ferredoxin oxidoreductase beta subunit